MISTVDCSPPICYKTFSRTTSPFGGRVRARDSVENPRGSMPTKAESLATDRLTATDASKCLIRSETARPSLSFAFACFRDRPITKAETEAAKVIVVNEAYTSKTAKWTGETVHKLGGSKTIRSQNVVLDRDLNAALGIVLKALPDRPFVGLPTTALQHRLAADGKEK